MPVVLLIAFVGLPLAEIYTISRVGSVLGLPLTLGLLLLISVAGAAVVKREGLRTWRALRSSLGAGAVPARELADGALVLVGGVLLLTPGFLTDGVGLLLVLPPTRAVVRRLLLGFAVRRALRVSSRSSRTRPGSGQVIEGTVIDHPAGEAGPPAPVKHAIRPRPR